MTAMMKVEVGRGGKENQKRKFADKDLKPTN